MSLIICPGFKLLKFLAGSLQAVEGLVVFWPAATEVSLIAVVTSKDTLVPYEHGRRLYDLAKNSQRQFIILNNCEHNEVFFDTKKNGHTKVIEWISQN